MGRKENRYHVEEMRGKKNWENYYADLRAVLVIENYWNNASSRVKLRSKSVIVEGPRTVEESEISATDTEQQEAYEKDLLAWEKEKDEFDEGHEQAMSVIHLTSMPEPREHVKGHTNAEEAIARLLKQYGTSNSYR